MINLLATPPAWGYIYIYPLTQCVWIFGIHLGNYMGYIYIYGLIFGGWFLLGGFQLGLFMDITMGFKISQVGIHPPVLAVYIYIYIISLYVAHIIIPYITHITPFLIQCRSSRMGMGFAPGQSCSAWLRSVSRLRAMPWPSRRAAGRFFNEDARWFRPWFFEVFWLVENRLEMTQNGFYRGFYGNLRGNECEMCDSSGVLVGFFCRDFVGFERILWNFIGFQLDLL